MTLSNILAEGEQAAAPGGIDPIMIILGIMVVFLVFMMLRNRKKAAAAQEEKKSKLVPGAEVMTTAGLFATVVSIDTEANRVVLEVSPGTTMTFDARAISQFVEEPAAVVADSPADAAAARGELNLSKDTDATDTPASDEDGPEGQQPRP